MTATVGVVLPAYRPDVDTLAAYLHSIREVLDPAEIRIEVDAATDEVRDALEALPATVHAVPYRRGKGAAVTEGFEALGSDILAFADADGSTPAASMADVVRPVADGTVDLAAGSRRHADSTVASHQTWARRYMGDAFAWLARTLLEVPLSDFQCGAKAISASGWATVREHLYEAGFAWDVELIAMANALDLSIGEVPVEWHDRPGSTVAPVSDAVRLGQALIRSRHRSKQLRDDRLHTAVAAARDDPTALVDKQR
jgi:glycosyltransferase involved in cell wall biosynthesis